MDTGRRSGWQDERVVPRRPRRVPSGFRAVGVEKNGARVGPHGRYMRVVERHVRWVHVPLVGAPPDWWVPVGTFFLAFRDSLPATEQRWWDRVGRIYAAGRVPAKRTLAPVAASVRRIEPTLPEPAHRMADGRRVELVTTYLTDRQGAAWLSLYLGTTLRHLRPCTACPRLWLVDHKHPDITVCPGCRPGSGQRPATWLPQRLRPAWRRLRSRLDQQVHREGLTSEARARCLVVARQNAERVRDGEMEVKEWVNKWGRPRRWPEK